MFETQRLSLRELTNRDVDDVFEMRRDPEIMKYIREPQANVLESVNWIAMISAHLETTGIGFLAIIEKQTGEFLGWCGLWILKETGEVEIGYALRKESWGKGYATEAARRVLSYAFDELHLDRVVAVALPENSGSVNIMKKLGMKSMGIGRFYEKDLIKFAIQKKEFKEMNVD